MTNGSLTERALAFATTAHLGQKRKSSGLPYVFHVVDVAKRLGDAGVRDEDVIVAGLLHDVLEDTEVAQEDVSASFGARAAGFVQEMTFDETARTKGEYLASFARGSVEALAIKLMDRAANVADYEREKPDYAPKYAGLASSLYAAVFAREADLAATFGEDVSGRMITEARRLEGLARAH